jgi:8-amino-3,8-dideoxy-alpha-D-manno-octulosonate transaminase
MPGFEVIGKEERDAVNEIFDRGGVLYRYGWADKRQNIYRVDEFERAFADRMGVKYALALSSGTAALKATLISMGVKPGDEVITQSYTFIATVEAILETGATPVIADIDRTLNMDPADLERRITNRTKAVIPVHMMGVAAEMNAIIKTARSHDLLVLEDNAQSCGGAYKNRLLGTIGDAGITSFDFGKVLTTGEGGMIMTDSHSIFRTAREYHDHGHELNPAVPRGEDTRSISGFNFKMTDLQAAIGLAQLKKLDMIISLQRKNKQAIKEGIRDLPGIEFREIPNPEGDIGDSVVFFLKDRTSAQRFMKSWTSLGFGTKNLPDAINWHYAETWEHLFYRHEQYAGKNLESLFAQSTGILRRAIAIPVFALMEEHQIEKIVSGVRTSLKGI